MLRSLLFILLMMLDVGWIRGLCVYEQDFGFTLDCAFKKSTLFRIRNLGGVKGYVGIGFTVGDDLKFKESLSNEADATRRRSAPNPPGDASTADSATGRSHSGRNPLLAWASAGGLPGKMPGVYPGVATPVPVGVFQAPSIATVPPFKPLGGGGGGGGSSSSSGDDVVTVPPFSALPPSIARIPTIKKVQIPPSPLVFQKAAVAQMANRRHQTSASDLGSEAPVRNSIMQIGKITEPSSSLVSFDPSDAMPSDTLSTRRLNESPSSSSVSAQAAHQALSQMDDLDISSPSPLLMGHSVQSLSEASNISVEALAAALRLREQQLLASVTSSTTTSTTTTTPRPTKPPTIRPKYPLVGPNRVMNAPKEYYPVSYDKNYDDNFTSKVELPETSFTCGDQKHFPGLYADEDLGCMVFHVCAFTDDGMVMKSFLCPESTLFDQSILKCNWWFYVDCKSSKRLYDSNIPISKSYQLMKALAFFSSYKNQTTNST